MSLAIFSQLPNDILTIIYNKTMKLQKEHKDTIDSLMEDVFEKYEWIDQINKTKKELYEKYGDPILKDINNELLFKLKLIDLDDIDNVLGRFECFDEDEVDIPEEIDIYSYEWYEYIRDKEDEHIAECVEDLERIIWDYNY